MRYLICGRTTLESRLFFHEIIYRYYRGVEFKKMAPTKYHLVNGNSFEILSVDVCRGKREDLILYYDCLDAIDIYNNMSGEAMSWSEFVSYMDNRNSYSVELI